MLSKRKRGTWLSVIGLSLFLTMLGCSAPPDITRVVEVIDGDTITIEGGYRVRYIGIDTPEIYPGLEAYGQKAWQANRKLVGNKPVRLERDISETDKYGRLLRYVYVDGIFVNAELVRQGLAQVKAYPPDTKYQSYLEQMQTEAKLAGRGMWSK